MSKTEDRKRRAHLYNTNHFKCYNLWILRIVNSSLQKERHSGRISEKYAFSAVETGFVILVYTRSQLELWSWRGSKISKWQSLSVFNTEGEVNKWI